MWFTQYIYFLHTQVHVYGKKYFTLVIRQRSPSLCTVYTSQWCKYVVKTKSEIIYRYV